MGEGGGAPAAGGGAEAGALPAGRGDQRGEDGASATRAGTGERDERGRGEATTARTGRRALARRGDGGIDACVRVDVSTAGGCVGVLEGHTASVVLWWNGGARSPAPGKTARCAWRLA